MLRKSTGTCALLAFVGAVAACSSSSSSTTTTPDAGKDTGTSPKKDGGSDGGQKGHDGGRDAVAHADAGTAGPTARFIYDGSKVPNLFDVPFPSDLYLVNGKVMKDLPGASAIITNSSTFITDELVRLNGFSRIAQAFFYVDDKSASDGVATIDETTLPTSEAACVADGSSVFLLDLSATGAAARMPCRAAFHDDRALNAAMMTTGYRPTVSVGPGRGFVLKEGHQYATVMTNRVKTSDGKAVGASADFLALSEPVSKSTPYSTALRTAQGLLKSALGADSVVDMALFTTNSNTSVLLQMRTNLESVTVPTLAWDKTSLAPMGAVKFAAPVEGKLPTGFTASLDDYFGTVSTPVLTSPKSLEGDDDPNADLAVRAHNNIAAIGTAVFQAENYLSPANGYQAVGQATFSYDANGNVVPDSTTPKVPIWVTFFVPTSTMPAHGYPVVIVQHGLGESRADEPFNLANTLASQGWLVAAIDSVTFGARADEPALQVDKVNNFANTASSYTGPDGLADAPTNGLNDFAGVLLDIGAIRDHLRQDAIDTSQLARVLAAATTDLSPLKTGAAAPKIDGTRIAYIGNSLGGIQGAMAAAIEPLVQNWVLNVAGGGFMLEVVAHSAYIEGLGYTTFAGLNFGTGRDRLSESHPLISFWQTVVDPGDPIDFASYVVNNPATVNGGKLTPKNILQVEVLYDKFVPNESNEALARALGLGLATPNQGSNSGISTLGMVKDPTTIPDRLTFLDANPDDAGLIHDTPLSGTTAVLVQVSPGQHGSNFQNLENAQQFAIPYDQFTTATPFVQLGMGTASADPPFSVKGSYLQQQSMIVRFLTDGFAAGGKAPNVTGFVAPVRDYDGDGVVDSTDTDVNNPNVH